MIKKFKYYFVIVCFLCFFNISHSQKKKIDSLLNILKTAKEDTNRVKALNKLGWQFKYSNPDSTILLAKQAISLAQKINFKTGLAVAYTNAGVGYDVKGDYAKALENYFAGLKIDELLKNKTGIAIHYGNIGLVYREQANYPLAIDYYFKALKIDEELGNRAGISIHFNNIGLVYLDQGDAPNALEYYFKALKIDEELGSKNGIGRLFGNIGNVYASQNDFVKALDYYFKALKIDEELGNKDGVGRHLGNIGNIYDRQADHHKALNYHFRALKIAEELGNSSAVARHFGNIGVAYKALADTSLTTSNRDSTIRNEFQSKALHYFSNALKINEKSGDKYGIAMHLSNIGSLYIDQAKNITSMKELELKYKAAEEFLLRALSINIEIGAKNEEMIVEGFITELYEITGRHKEALGHYKRAMALKSILFSEEKNKEITRKGMNYEFEKKEAIAKAEQDKKDAVTKIIIYSVSGGFVLVFILAIFIFRGYRQKQKANIVISEQKFLVEEKQKEILDSIHYAKRIQNSLMPTEKYIDKSFNRLKEK